MNRLALTTRFFPALFILGGMALAPRIANADCPSCRRAASFGSFGMNFSAPPSAYYAPTPVTSTTPTVTAQTIADQSGSGQFVFAQDHWYYSREGQWFCHAQGDWWRLISSGWERWSHDAEPFKVQTAAYTTD